MQHFKMRLLTLMVFFITLSFQAQTKKIGYSAELGTYMGSENLPFYFWANQFGAVPNNNHTQLTAAIYSDFQKPSGSFDFSYKASFTGYSKSTNKPIINELYGSMRYKNWRLDIGSKNNDVELDGLSATNGDIIKSTNARAYPGYNLYLNNFVNLPFAKKWLKVRGNYSDYFLNDNRVVKHPYLHHKSLFLKFKITDNYNLITGLDHYVIWGGTSETYGRLPSSFKDYLKVIYGGSGGGNAVKGEQTNALGNTVGDYLVQLNHSGDKMNWKFYWSHPFEDRSGRELANYPDALYGLLLDFKKPQSIVNKLVLECYYTKNMSGSNPPDQGEDANGNTIHGRGQDNYFNNGIYQSGWTYFGNTIGAPFFITNTPVNGITNGIKLGYNRFVAFHIGLSGQFSPKLTYQLKSSYINYAGWFTQPFTNTTLFSSMVQLNYRTPALPFEFTFSFGTDVGNNYPSTIGSFLRITKKGFF